MDDAASGLVRARPRTCEECRSGGTVKGAARIVLEPEPWSGGDVFGARGLPGKVSGSGRFGDLCE